MPTHNKGQHVNVGADNAAAKLHPAHVQIIRYLRAAQGLSYDAISDELYHVYHIDIAPQTIGFICRGERWKLLPQPPNVSVIAMMA